MGRAVGALTLTLVGTGLGLWLRYSQKPALPAHPVDFAALPLSFEPNVGQAPAVADFVARSADGVALVGSGRLSVVSSPRRSPHAVTMRLVGARPSRPEGRGRLPGTVNAFLGSDSAAWRSNVPTYAAIVEREVYEGIDWVVRGDGRHVEYDFVVKPGGRVEAIALLVEGPVSLEVLADGSLRISQGEWSVRQRPPRVFQESSGARREVAGRYAVEGSTVRFRVGAHDDTATLVVDPSLAYGTYLGGASADSEVAIALDAAGQASVAGFTNSIDFPVTGGVVQPILSGTEDVVVSELNAAGTALVYSTYLGGSGVEDPKAIVVDAIGQTYVAGFTTSTNFPVTTGTFQKSHAGGTYDAFVTKLGPGGTVLVYSTYLGGSGNDFAYSIAVDSSGQACVTGNTVSANFPTTAGAYQTTFAGGAADVFVAKLSVDGKTLVFSTFLGGTGEDDGNALALDPSGNLYVTGETTSLGFPTTAGAFQTTHAGGNYDAFVTELNSAGAALVYSTYLGGPSADDAAAITVDDAGSAYVTGFTGSLTFPTTAGAFQTIFDGGTYDVFVTKLQAGGAGLVYSTLLGGSGDEQAYAIVLDSSGDAYLTGQTSSTNFPATNGAFQTAYGGGNTDGFVTRLNAAGTTLDYSTYLGGSGDDVGQGLALDAAADAVVVGQTSSIDFPTTAGAFEPDAGGGVNDGFVAKLGVALSSQDGGSASDGGAATDGGAPDGGSSGGGADSGSSDGGTSDAGSTDGGAFDGGSAVDAGASHAGGSPVHYRVGCDCSSSPVAPALWMALLCALVRRRTRGS